MLVYWWVLQIFVDNHESLNIIYIAWTRENIAILFIYGSESLGSFFSSKSNLNNYTLLVFTYVLHSTIFTYSPYYVGILAVNVLMPLKSHTQLTLSRFLCIVFCRDWDTNVEPERSALSATTRQRQFPFPDEILIILCLSNIWRSISLVLRKISFLSKWVPVMGVFLLFWHCFVALVIALLLLLEGMLWRLNHYLYLWVAFPDGSLTAMAASWPTRP